MKDIKVGDFVSNTYGGVSKVLNKWNNTQRRIYQITFEDGRKIECADNHMWTFTCDGKKYYEGNTKEVINQMRGDNIYLPLTQPVFYQNQMEDVLPTLMGILIGIGKPVEQEEITNISKEDLKNYGILQKNGKIADRLPSRYMHMSVEHRVELIKGLLTTGGYYDEESKSFCIDIKSEMISRKVRQILFSLGATCSMKYSYLTGKYRLTFDFFSNEFRQYVLGEWFEQQGLPFPVKDALIGLKIESIKYLHDDACQCIEVDQVDHLYLIDEYVVTHNSAQICQRICYLFLTREDMAFAVVRSTMPALTRSVYLGDPSIVKTLKDWGVPVNNWLNKTEATIRNPLNNSVMYFIGLDDPEKIKSMNLNYIFIEEATEINADKWSQLNTRLRRFNPYGKNQMYIAYNPISYYNWVVQMFVANPDPLIKEDSIVHFSNFTQNPYVNLENVKGWFARAQHDENYYRSYIVGIPGRPLGLIYPDIAFTPKSTWPQEVWDAKPYYGIDWGYIDPMVLVECRDYEGKTYAICRFYRTKVNTKDFIQFIEDLGVPKTQNIYYDSADAERGSLLLQKGFTAFKAKKDILAGISFVKGMDIIVDSEGEFGQCAMDEIKSYAWQTDKDDSSKFIEEPAEENNHFCDQIRYQCVTEHIFNRKFGTGQMGFQTVEERLRKGGIYNPNE